MTGQLGVGDGAILLRPDATPPTKQLLLDVSFEPPLKLTAFEEDEFTCTLQLVVMVPPPAD